MNMSWCATDPNQPNQSGDGQADSFESFALEIRGFEFHCCRKSSVDRDPIPENGVHSRFVNRGKGKKNFKKVLGETE